jgi:glycosyltransferase involved in cell wall biosynthesis
MNKVNTKQTPKDEKKVAIVHDFLLYPGGAERVLADICDMYPDAPVYTLLYDKGRMGEYFEDKDIRTSFLQKYISFAKKHHRWLLPFFGAAVESFDLRDFDLVISSSGAWSKGIVTRLNTKHVAYIHSPMRYVWDENEYYLKKNTKIKNGICTRILLSYLRVWDHQAAQRPDILVANSLHTKKRINKYYRRDAELVYPGVGVEPFIASKNKKDNYFLIISRLSAYKNVALAIEVCNKLQLPLIVIGEGKEKKELEQKAGKTITIKGWVDEKEKVKYLQNARALLFPAEDDFGIVCVEAMQVGTPVIALARGGAQEVVLEGCGETFEAPTVEMIADAMRRFLEKEKSYDVNVIRAQGNKFSKQNFQNKLSKIIQTLLNS